MYCKFKVTRFFLNLDRFLGQCNSCHLPLLYTAGVAGNTLGLGTPETMSQRTIHPEMDSNS